MDAKTSKNVAGNQLPSMEKGGQENLQLITKFVDPLTDYGFRFYFGSEARKEILIEFLNDLFDGRNTLKTLNLSLRNMTVTSEHI